MTNAFWSHKIAFYHEIRNDPSKRVRNTVDTIVDLTEFMLKYVEHANIALYSPKKNDRPPAEIWECRNSDFKFNDNLSSGFIPINLDFTDLRKIAYHAGLDERSMTLWDRLLPGNKPLDDLVKLYQEMYFTYASANHLDERLLRNERITSIDNGHTEHVLFQEACNYMNRQINLLRAANAKGAIQRQEKERFLEKLYGLFCEGDPVGFMSDDDKIPEKMVHKLSEYFRKQAKIDGWLCKVMLLAGFRHQGKDCVDKSESLYGALLHGHRYGFVDVQYKPKQDYQKPNEDRATQGKVIP